MSDVYPFLSALKPFFTETLPPYALKVQINTAQRARFLVLPPHGRVRYDVGDSVVEVI